MWRLATLTSAATAVSPASAPSSVYTAGTEGHMSGDKQTRLQVGRATETITGAKSGKYTISVFCATAFLSFGLSLPPPHPIRHSSSIHRALVFSALGWFYSIALSPSGFTRSTFSRVTPLMRDETSQSHEYSVIQVLMF